MFRRRSRYGRFAGRKRYRAKSFGRYRKSYGKGRFKRRRYGRTRSVGVARRALNIAKYVRRKCRVENKLIENELATVLLTGTGGDAANSNTFTILPQIQPGNGSGERDGVKVTQTLSELILRVKAADQKMVDALDNEPALVRIMVVEFDMKTNIMGGVQVAPSLTTILHNPARFWSSRKVKSTDAAFVEPYKVLADTRFTVGHNWISHTFNEVIAMTNNAIGTPNAGTVTHVTQPTGGPGPSMVKYYRYKSNRRRQVMYENTDNQAVYKPVFCYIMAIAQAGHVINFNATRRFYFTDA